ncbi:MAG TPA: MFS transporter, partial [Gammaproteobacteria bacterium]|nr:MFS transporter [Gammaproteobacteria bacterium]
LTITIAALGYFVDVYDLLLFSVVRITSLRDLGVEENQLSNTGMMILNLQMVGMLLGGIVWGILGDKKGRVSVLFSTILLYSLANIANAYVTSVEMYAFLRFIAGIGLAGELGIGITLVSEIMSKENRGYGTAFVTAFGTSGAVVAAIVADLVSWKTAYLLGGSMGLLLLIMRVSLLESPMFNQIKYKNIKAGNIRLLFISKKHFLTYFNCILIGLPIWFIVGILISFSPELAKSLEITGDINAGKAVLFSQIGTMIGGFLCGILSQKLKSRKKAVASFMIMTLIVITIYLFSYGQTPMYMYTLCLILGFAGGYWALFVAIAAEQFGTNLRATVSTTAPNFVRGSVVITTFAFSQLNAYFSLNISILIVGWVCIGIAVLALNSMKETYGENLDYIH